MQIITVIENSKGENLALKAEHGISFYIDMGSHALIFDTGQSGAFVENALNLGLDLDKVSLVCISHGHYDHSGGLRALAAINHHFRLVVGKGFFQKKYSTNGIVYEFLGNNFDEQFLANSGIEWRYAQDPVEEMEPGIYLLSDFPRIFHDERVNPRFVLQSERGFIPDAFHDEIALALASSRGFLLLVGCSHPGIKNMLEAAASRLPGPIYGVMGGTHLVEASEESRAASIQYFSEKGFHVLGVSHCTGDKATVALQQTCNGFFRNATGHELVL